MMVNTSFVMKRMIAIIIAVLFVLILSINSEAASPSTDISISIETWSLRNSSGLGTHSRQFSKQIATVSRSSFSKPRCKHNHLKLSVALQEEWNKGEILIPVDLELTDDDETILVSQSSDEIILSGGLAPLTDRNTMLFSPGPFKLSEKAFSFPVTWVNRLGVFNEQIYTVAITRETFFSALLQCRSKFDNFSE